MDDSSDVDVERTGDKSVETDAFPVLTTVESMVVGVATASTGVNAGAARMPGERGTGRSPSSTSFSTSFSASVCPIVTLLILQTLEAPLASEKVSPSAPFLISVLISVSFPAPGASGAAVPAAADVGETATGAAGVDSEA